jgi:hypothetical protein
LVWVVIITSCGAIANTSATSRVASAIGTTVRAPLSGLLINTSWRRMQIPSKFSCSTRCLQQRHTVGPSRDYLKAHATRMGICGSALLMRLFRRILPRSASSITKSVVSCMNFYSRIDNFLSEMVS